MPILSTDLLFGDIENSGSIFAIYSYRIVLITTRIVIVKWLQKGFIVREKVVITRYKL